MDFAFFDCNRRLLSGIGGGVGLFIVRDVRRRPAPSVTGSGRNRLSQQEGAGRAGGHPQ